VNPNILVVEDEDALATLLQYNLEKEGYRVAVTGDGEEALVLVEEKQPDLWCSTGCCRRCRASRSAAGFAGARDRATCRSSC
jgi:DNA-binding NtrC family response regulator